MTGTELRAFVKAMPKADLHCHVVGAMRPATLEALAAKHGVRLGKSATQLYDFDDFYGFIEVLRLAGTVLRDREDFARLAFEAIEDGVAGGNLRHVEFMFNPQYFYPAGVAYCTAVDGLCDGLNQARRQFGVSGLLIACIDRQIDPGAAKEILADILAYRRDEVVGIGLDGPERAGPPQFFAEIYQAAAKAGLKRTAHCCEDNQTLTEAPPQHYAICRDLLGCDRIDHGYNLLADEAMTRRARDDGLFFTACGITSMRKNLLRRRESIARMVQQGLNVTLNTDDPAMFKTEIGHSYAVLFEHLGWGLAEARRFSLAGIAASWLDESDKRAMTSAFESELDRLSRDASGAGLHQQV
jgi:adenosine deaminase